MFFNFFKKIKTVSLQNFIHDELKATWAECPPELFSIRRMLPEYDRIRENDFIAKILYWHKPSLDVTWFALKILDNLGEFNTIGLLEKFILPYVERSAKRKDGYRQSVAEYNISPSMHALHSAIGVMNIYLNSPSKVDWGTPITRLRIEEKFGQETVDLMIKFIKSSYKDGGFSDEVNSPPTINATASAMWCLWQLEALEECCDFEEIMDFINRHRVDISNDEVGFKNSLLCNEPFVCSTYYTFRILYSIEQHFGHTLQFHNKLLCDKHKIRNFILNSKVVNSGFAPRKGMKPTIIHTKNALSLFQDKYKLEFRENISPDTYSSIKEDVLKFIKSSSCSDDSLLCGFAERSLYFPNIYSTLLNMDIRKIIFNDKSSPSSVKLSNLFDERQKKECIDYLGTCFDSKVGAYRGYSYSSNYIPSSWKGTMNTQ